MNSELFFQIYNLGGHNLFMDKLMIFGANDLIFLTFFFIFFLILFGKTQERKAFLLIIIGLIVVETAIQITHFFFFEPRPFVTFNLVPLIKHTADAAFPSGHTTIMATVAFAYLFCKSKYAVLFLLAMLWVGFARIYVGVHYPLDILGGITYGFTTIFLSSKLLNKFLSV